MAQMLPQATGREVSATVLALRIPGTLAGRHRLFPNATISWRPRRRVRGFFVKRAWHQLTNVDELTKGGELCRHARWSCLLGSEAVRWL